MKFCYQQVVGLGIKLIKIIEKFHDLGFVHCDIKPDNILFGLNSKKSFKK